MARNSKYILYFVYFKSVFQIGVFEIVFQIRISNRVFQIVFLICISKSCIWKYVFQIVYFKTFKYTISNTYFKSCISRLSNTRFQTYFKSCILISKSSNTRFQIRRVFDVLVFRNGVFGVDAQSTLTSAYKSVVNHLMSYIRTCG